MIIASSDSALWLLAPWAFLLLHWPEEILPLFMGLRLSFRVEAEISVKLQQLFGWKLYCFLSHRLHGGYLDMFVKTDRTWNWKSHQSTFCIHLGGSILWILWPLWIFRAAKWAGRYFKLPWYVQFWSLDLRLQAGFILAQHMFTPPHLCRVREPDSFVWAQAWSLEPWKTHKNNKLQHEA